MTREPERDTTAPGEASSPAPDAPPSPPRDPATSKDGASEVGASEVGASEVGASEVGASESTEASDDLLTRGVDAALYGLSLPERVLRGMVGCASGVARETAELAVPDGMKSSRLYDMTVRKMLGFLVDDVAKFRAGAPDGDASGSDYVAKIAVGNVIDVAGLAVLHVSPLWVFAIVSDVTRGSKTYLNALAAELKEQGILEKSATIDSLDAILDNLEATSGLVAENLDTPPITLDELKTSVSKLREESQRVDLREAFPAEDLAAIWKEIETTAETENRSVLEVSNAIAMMTFSQITRVGRGAYSGVKVGFDLLNDNVFRYYSQAFEEIHSKGYYQSVLDAYEPYVDGLKHLFDEDTETTTEQVLKGRPIRWLGAKIRGWFGGLRDGAAGDAKPRS